MNARKLMQLQDMALALSRDLDGYHKHISIITRKNRPVAIGHNQGKTHPEHIRRNYFGEVPHSELAAYLKVPYTLRDNLTLINFRFNRQGDLRIARPCIRCENWVRELFAHVYFSTDTGLEQLK